MTEIELDQIGFTEDRSKLYLFLPSDNFGLYMASDISLDKAVQDISLNEDEIEPTILNQIQH